MSLASLAFCALVLGSLSGSFLQLGGGRPDTVLAFIAAAVGRRQSQGKVFALSVLLAGVRVILGPKGAAVEALALVTVASLSPLFFRKLGFGSFVTYLGTCLLGYGALLVALFLWFKGTSRSFFFPPAETIGASLFLTFTLCLAFSELLAYGEERWQ